MITRKELGYVGLWPKSVPYPGDIYAEETMEKLKQADQLFKNIYENNAYNITFSNNDEIELEIQARNLSHILGINYRHLYSEYMKEFVCNLLDIDSEKPLNSYLLLQKIIENSDKVINSDKTNDSMRIMNYYKTSVKCDIFSKLGDITKFNFACINFDRNEFDKNAPYECKSNSTKYLYIPSDEPVAPYFLMGILPHNPNNPNNPNYQNNNVQEDEDYTEMRNRKYVIETSVAPEEVEYYFQNQEVVIPTQILKDSNKILERTTATPEQKMKLLKEYRSIITTYELSNRINIYSDYLSLLSQEESKIKTITK